MAVPLNSFNEILKSYVDDVALAIIIENNELPLVPEYF